MSPDPDPPGPHFPSPHPQPSSATDSIEDRLDALVAEYSERLEAGEPPARAPYLERVEAARRPALERCLKMIEAGRARVPSATLLRSGSRLGRYEISSELGRGGMSIVFLARDLELERPVALKVLRPGLAVEERHADRFRREAHAVARLVHPHAVAIFDVGREQGLHYLAMEFVEGPSLATVLGALPRARALNAEDLARAAGIPQLAECAGSFEAAVAALLAPVAQALASAHELGLVHRDVKPSNILIHPDGRAVIADFGLAKGDGDPALSLSGDPLGTPHYMPPEQARASSVQIDYRSDVYSLGVSLYEALSGRRPFEGESVLEVLDAIRTAAPAPLVSRDAAASQDAAAVVRRAIARDPEQRYATMADLEADLRQLARGGHTQARAEEGGALRRAAGQVSLAFSGYPYEYRSARTFAGLPLVHVNLGPRQPGRRLRRARGWLAVGHLASGGIALGHVAVGGIALATGVSAGAIGLAGGATLGLLAAFAGGLALGSLASAGVALGGFVIGGVALGWAAVGGYARGHFAAGGDVDGAHVMGPERIDPEAEAFFGEWMPWIVEAMRGG